MRVLILGTGTGVGKTFVTAALARALAASRPVDVIALKPIETGFPKTHTPGSGGSVEPATATDAATLEAASTLKLQHPHPRYSFFEPISPHLAARRARSRISIRSVATWLADAERLALRGATLPFFLVETAGGVFSPLGPRRTNADLARRLEPAIWILVAPDSLGVLHDVRATWLALQAVARTPDYLVLSSARAPDASTGSNAAELPRIGLPRPIAALPRGDAGLALAPLVRALNQRCSTLPRR